MFTKNGESIGGVAQDFVQFLASVLGLIPLLAGLVELSVAEPIANGLQ